MSVKTYADCRCFPHVVNIAVKTGLSRLGEVDLSDADNVTDEEIFEFTPPPPQDTAISEQYTLSLAKDLVKCARKLVNTCRASGKRRDALRDEILAIRQDSGIQMRVVVLLRDVDTHWSSTFMMIDRLLELYPVCFMHSRFH